MDRRLAALTAGALVFLAGPAGAAIVDDPVRDEVTRVDGGPSAGGLCHDPGADAVGAQAYEQATALVATLQLASGTSSLTCGLHLPAVWILRTQALLLTETDPATPLRTILFLDIEQGAARSSCATLDLTANGLQRIVQVCQPYVQGAQRTWSLPLVGSGTTWAGETITWDITGASYRVVAYADAHHRLVRETVSVHDETRPFTA